MIEQGRDSMTATALRLAAVLSAAAYATVLLISTRGPVAGSFGTGGGPGPALTDSDPLIGFSLIGAGAATSLAGRSRVVGLLASLAGIAWLGSTLASSPNGSDKLRGLGIALEPLLVVTLLALVVALAPTGIGRRTSIRLPALLLGIATLLSILRLVTYDPASDPSCLAACPPVAPFLPATATERLWLGRAVDAVAVIAGAGLILYGLASLRSYRHLRGSMLAAVGGGVMAGVGLAGRAATSLGGETMLARIGGADDVAGTGLGVATTIGGGLLAIGLAWSILDALRMGVRMRRVADDIASAAGPRTLETRLAEALHDDSVIVGYWQPDEARYVTPEGLPLEPPPPAADRRPTAIERDGKPVAAIWHRAGIDAGAIRAEVTPSVLVALDNERLQAVGLANLRSLEASRARVVSVQDMERRRIERDLHDGVQQRLLAIVFDLRLARLAAERVGEEARASRITRAEGLALSVLEELRRLARGIHPAVLSQAGLAAALASLADEAPIPLNVSMDQSIRLPEPVEAAVYTLIAEALADAVRLGAEEISVAVQFADVAVDVDIDHDGDPSPPSPVRIADRVAAAGGSLAVGPGTRGSGRRIRVALPCG